MRITIQITCDDVADAQLVMQKLAMSDTAWPLRLDAAEPKIKGSAEKPGVATTSKNNSVSEVPAKEAPRPNKNPGTPSIGKIGGATKGLLFAELEAGRQPTEKFVEHMKLLWSRGEVKFDGDNYYL